MVLSCESKGICLMGLSGPMGYIVVYLISSIISEKTIRGICFILKGNLLFGLW